MVGWWLYGLILSYTIQYIGDIHELGYSMNQRSIGRSLHFFWSIEMSKLSDQHFVAIFGQTWAVISWFFFPDSFPFGYGSIPINTIFRGMNIHLPAILMFTRGTRFWHTAILGYFGNIQVPFATRVFFTVKSCSFHQKWGAKALWRQFFVFWRPSWAMLSRTKMGMWSKLRGFTCTLW